MIVPDNYVDQSQIESIAINSQGNIIAFGNFMDNLLRGAVFVYYNNNNVWVQAGKLVPSNAVSSDYVGISTALNSEGSL